jgi:hypothetical protein
MDPFLLVLLIVLAALVVGVVLVMRRIRTQRQGALDVVNAHPGETAIPAGLLSGGGTTSAERARVVAVLVDGERLSFRDRADAEVVRIATDRIMSVEFAPLNPRSALRPARVALVDGPPVDFFLGVPADRQIDTVMTIRAAIGR